MRAILSTLALTSLAAEGCSAPSTVGEQGGCLLGFASGDGTGPATELQRLEALVGRRMDLDRIYRQWDNAAPGSRERDTTAAGRIPVVSFNGRLPDQAMVSWASVASGEHDAYLAEVARAFRDLKSKVFVMYHHNPDKELGAFGSAEEYRQAYRHVVQVFDQAGASNVVWTFTMRSPSFPSEADALYPGDDVVQWIGANVYNFSSESDGKLGRWITLRGLLSDFLSWAAAHDKLLMLAEWASREDPSDEDRKASWLEESLETVREQRRLRAIVYYHEGPQLAVDTSPRSLEAFLRVAHDPFMNMNQALDASPAADSAH